MPVEALQTDVSRYSPARGRDPDYRELVIALVVVWGVCDGVSTITAAAFAGVHLEANPLIQELLVVPSLALVVKVAVAVLAGGIALAGERFIRTVPGWQFYFATLIGLGIAVTAINLLVAFS